MPSHSDVKQQFFLWLDAMLDRPIPSETQGFHFNLYEGTDSVHVQLVGADSFNAVGEYWPGTDIFSTGEDIFEVPFQNAGAAWKDWLAYIKELCRSYIETGRRADTLRRAKGVGIGFVDGDMYVLWQSPAA